MNATNLHRPGITRPLHANATQFGASPLTQKPAPEEGVQALLNYYQQRHPTPPLGSETDIFVRRHPAPDTRFANDADLVHAVNQLVDSMSEKQVQQFSHLFRSLMTSSQTPIGYTLFGDKPMSFVEFDEVRTEELAEPARAWLRFAEKKLPNSNFKLQLKDQSPPNIYIFNKYVFLHAVNKNLPAFKAVLGPNITPDLIFEDIANDRLNVLSKLRSQALYGLLFGLPPEDVLSGDEDNINRDEWKPVTDFDPTANDRRGNRVRLPGALSIRITNPGSMALVESWKQLQPHLQAIVDIQDNRKFLRKMIMPFVRDQG